jgi:hypothetical protein
MGFLVFSKQSYSWGHFPSFHTTLYVRSHEVKKGSVAAKPLPGVDVGELTISLTPRELQYNKQALKKAKTQSYQCGAVDRNMTT